MSSQNAERLPAGGSGQSTVLLRPDTVTLSAVFPPPPPVDGANFVQFQSPAQPALEAFPPASAQTSGGPARVALASNATTAPTPTQQEQLAELDRVLERLGISPQSISLDNRLALIKSANDPPALLNSGSHARRASTRRRRVRRSALLTRTISRTRPPPEINHKPQLRTNLKPSLHLHRLLRFKAQAHRRAPGSGQLPRRLTAQRHHPQSKLTWPAMRLCSSRSCRLFFRTPTKPARSVQTLITRRR